MAARRDIDPKTRLMKFGVEVVPTPGQEAEAEKRKLIGAFSGGKAVRHWIKQADGTMTDAETGEVMGVFPEPRENPRESS